jgi:release factor glutamine methyltransferase
LQLYLRLEDTVTTRAFKRSQQLFSQRARGIPLQYLTGIQEFWGLEYVVTPDVLIPRPETEILVEEVIRLVKDRQRSGTSRLVDLGTGSGCIAIALAKFLPGVEILATDISGDALTIARRNARRLGVDQQITFVKGNLFEPLKKRSAGQADMIISNPPYIPSDELQTLATEVKDHEPRIALDGGPDGLDLCRRIIQEAPNHLDSGGILVMEIGWKQSKVLSQWINRQSASSALGGGLPWDFEFRKDLSGIERVMILKRK